MQYEELEREINQLKREVEDLRERISFLLDDYFERHPVDDE